MTPLPVSNVNNLSSSTMWMVFAAPSATLYKFTMPQLISVI